MSHYNFFCKNKNKSHNIAQLCVKVEDQLKDELARINSEQIIQKMKRRDYEQILNVMSELDESNPAGFPMLFSFKQKDLNQVIELGQQVAQENLEEKKFPKRLIQIEAMKKELRRYRRK